MIKKALVSVFISVFAGVALFGAGAAFGAQLPSDVPPAGLVSPTFSGLYVTAPAPAAGPFVRAYDGEALSLIGGIATAIYAIADSAEPFILLNSPASPYGTGLYDVEIHSNSKGVLIDTSGNRTDIWGTTGISSLEVEGSIVNTDQFIADPVFIDDDVDISGGMKVDSIGSYTDHSTVTFGAQANFTEGAIFGISPSFPTETFFQKIHLTQDIDNPSQGTNGVTVSDPDGLRVLGPVKIDGAISNYSYGAVDVSDNLKVIGKITATLGIGTYATVLSAKVDVNPNGASGVATASCASGYSLIDCGMEAYDDRGSTTVSNDAFVIRKIKPSYSDNSCSIRVKNEWSEIRAVQAIARCFNAGL